MFYISTKIKIKVIVSSLLLLTSWMNLVASPLTPEQALNRLQSSSSAKRVVGKTPLVLAHTEKLNNQDYLFVFNRNTDGFVIASADDRMPALLGYSDNGAFDMATASPELKWWLGQYALVASQNLKSGISRIAGDNETRATRENIPYLISTTWDQSYPYNLKCPEVGGERCVTGCVATAMAQVINYHGFPVSGKGSYSYELNGWYANELKGYNLSYDYQNASFNYSAMLDSYDGNSTEEENDAVADLMFACGVAVDMEYSLNFSGAMDPLAASALKMYFNYDAGIRYLMRDYFTNEEWEDIIYEELKANRPVIYGGDSEGGGHDFICDGYEDGFFHINWGWGGYCDGYFNLSALNPDAPESDDASGGYTKSQSIVCGIQPDKGNILSWYPIYATGGIVGTEIWGNSNICVSFDNGGVFNYSKEDFNVELYLQATSDASEEVSYSPVTETEFPGNIAGYTAFWMNLPTDLTKGDYKLRVVIKLPNGDYQNLPIPLGLSDYIWISVDESGNIKIKDDVEPADPVSVTLDRDNLTLILGDSEALVATIEPENASSTPMTWTSSNDKVASVDVEGNVTAVGIGKAIITVECGDLAANCDVACYPQLGDANWDGEINITDAVDISNYILEYKAIPSDWDADEWKEFYIAGANSNGSEDGKITFADACETVSLALAQPAPSSNQSRARMTSDDSCESADALVIGNYKKMAPNGFLVPITLDNTKGYVALQADIEVPEGMNLVGVNIGNRAAVTHSITTRRIDDRHMRVALFDMGNSLFVESNETVMEIVVDGDVLDSDLIAVRNIIASDADANGYQLASSYNGESGIDSTLAGNVRVQVAAGGILIFNAGGMNVEVYTLDGKIIKSFVAASDSENVSVPSGVYMMKVGEKTLKIAK